MDSIEIGYRVKRTDTDYNCWISWGRKGYYFSIEEKCVLFKLSVLQNEVKLWNLVQENKLELVETKYKMINKSFDKIEIYDDNNIKINIDTSRWKVFDWDEDKPNNNVCISWR